MNPLLLVGLIIATTGAFSGLGAVIMELRSGEGKYMLLMKISSILFGVGGAIMGVSVAI